MLSRGFLTLTRFSRSDKQNETLFNLSQNNFRILNSA